MQRAYDGLNRANALVASNERKFRQRCLAQPSHRGRPKPLQEGLEPVSKVRLTSEPATAAAAVIWLRAAETMAMSTIGSGNAAGSLRRRPAGALPKTRFVPITRSRAQSTIFASAERR